MTASRTRVQLRRAWRPALLVLAGAIVALASGGMLLGQLSGGSPLGSKTTIRVAVDDAKSVVPGKNEVRWAGVVVGRLSAAKLAGEHAVLTAELEPGEVGPLYRDARLRLRPQTALNDMYLDVVDGGTPTAGRLRDGEVLDAGRTRTPVDVAEILNVFSVSVRDRFEQALQELSIGLPDRGAQLRSAFVELVPFIDASKRIGDAIARRDRVTRRLVNRVRLVTDELAGRDRAITRLIRHAGGTFETLGAHRADLDRTLRALPPTLTRMEGSFTRLKGTLGEARPALAALRPAVRRLPSGLRALRSLAGHADPALTALEPAVRALKPLARDLAPTAGALSTAFDRLGPQLPRVDRVTAKVARCEREVQKFFAWTMSVFKFGNRSNLTSSPRGLVVGGAAEATNGADPNLAAVMGCADGRPTP
jgi:virulence factor Mce-like protein